jgi:hypothetical protein
MFRNLLPIFPAIKKTRIRMPIRSFLRYRDVHFNTVSAVNRNRPNRANKKELISCLAVERLAAHLLAGRTLLATLLVAGVSLTVSGPLAFHV